MKKIYYLIRNSIMRMRWWRFRLMGMDIDKTAVISLKARLDFTYPKGVHIGAHTAITGGCVILTHDRPRKIHTDTWIGSHCVIGINAIVLPGVRIGDHCVVGAGSVVTKDVPPHTIVAGNPARVIRQGIELNDDRRIIKSEE